MISTLKSDKFMHILFLGPYM